MNKEKVINAIKGINKVEEVSLDMINQFQDALEQLEPQAKQVIVDRFGLEDGIQKPLKDLSAKMNMDINGLVELEDKAVKKLKRLTK